MGNVDLEVALGPLIAFGKIIGLISPWKKLRWNVIILPMLCVNIGVELVHVLLSSTVRKSPFDMAAAAGTPLFYGVGVFMYHYLYKHQLYFTKLFRQWKDTESGYYRKDAKLYRDVNFWAGTIFVSAILENAVFHIKQCPPQGASDNQLQLSFLHCIYNSMHAAWLAMIPYHDVVSIYLIISNKLALYAWNFMDILIIVLCRGIYFRFNELAENPVNTNWSKLRDEYVKLLLLMDDLVHFLSPMVFVSYGMNIYALCMQAILCIGSYTKLNLWLTPSKNKTTLDSVYSVWSSLHLLIRVLVVSLSAARVNDAAKKVQTLTKTCSTQLYTLDLIRLEDMATRNNIGVSGLGCFVVTKRFILSIVSVIFTFEVVLLQSVADTDTSCRH